MSQQNPECQEEADYWQSHEEPHDEYIGDNEPDCPEDFKKIEEQKIDEITNGLYEAYGSGTGVLFGIPSDLRASVRAIVKLVLEQAHKKT